MGRSRVVLCCVLVAALAGCGGGGGGAADAGPPTLPPGPSSDAGPIAMGEVFAFDEAVDDVSEREQALPAAAWTGAGHLVVWLDARERLRAQPVAADGSFADAVPLVIAEGHDVRRARLACTAGGAPTTCALLWIDGQGAAARSWLVRVAADGTPLDGAPLALAPGSHDLCATADGFLVLAADATSLRVTRVGTSGALADPGLDVVAAAAHPPVPGAPIACDASGALVAYGVCDEGAACESHVVRVDAEGPVGISRTVLGGARPVGLGAGAGGFLLVADRDDEDDIDLSGLRLDAAGAPVDPAPFTVLASEGIPLVTAETAVAFDGDAFLVATQEALSNVLGSAVLASRVAPGGAVTPSAPFEAGWTDDVHEAFAVSCGGGHCLDAFVDSGQIELVQVVAASATIPWLRLSHSANRQDTPAVASDGEGYLVVWEDWKGGVATVHTARLSASGAWLDAESLRVGQPELNPLSPRVAWNGEAYQVIWLRGGVVYGAQVDADGTVLDHDRYLFASNTDGTRLACGSDVCLATGQRPDGHQLVWRIGPDGRLVDGEPIDLGTRGPRSEIADVAYRAGVFAVVWESGDADGSDGLVVTRIGADGTVLDEAPSPLSRAGFDLAVVATADDFVVTWTGDLGPSAEGVDLGFGVFAERGGVLAEGTLAASAADEVRSAPVFDGVNVLVPFVERSRSSGRVMLRRVHPSGALLEVAPVPVAQDQPASGPASASTGRGDTLLVWDAFDPTPGIEATRLQLRLVHE